MGAGVWSLGFEVLGLGFEVWVWNSGLWVWNLGCGVWGLGFGVWGFRLGGWVSSLDQCARGDNKLAVLQDHLPLVLFLRLQVVPIFKTVWGCWEVLGFGI